MGLREHGNALAHHVPQRVFTGENVTHGASRDSEVESENDLRELYWPVWATRTIRRMVAGVKLESLSGPYGFIAFRVAQIGIKNGL